MYILIKLLHYVMFSRSPENSQPGKVTSSTAGSRRTWGEMCWERTLRIETLETEEMENQYFLYKIYNSYLVLILSD